MGKNSDGKPPSTTDAELHALQRSYEERRAHFLDQERALYRDRDDAPPRISDEQLQQVVDADQPRPRDVIAARNAEAAAPAHLAEAQVAITGRCTVCGKPVIGRDVPRDRQGRPRHHRCP